MEGKATKAEIWEHWDIIDLYQMTYLLDSIYIEQCEEHEKLKNKHGHR